MELHGRCQKYQLNENCAEITRWPIDVMHVCDTALLDKGFSLCLDKQQGKNIIVAIPRLKILTTVQQGEIMLIFLRQKNTLKT